MKSKVLLFLCITVSFILYLESCNQSPPAPIVVVDANPTAVASGIGKSKLSEYGFFTGDIAKQLPADRVIPYDLNTPLFTDYAHKLRFVYLPEGKKITYTEKDVLDFPVGTTIIKTFHYPVDFNQPEKGTRLMETRLLIHEEAGWKSLPYHWNEEQTEAYLEVAGGRKNIDWAHYDGKNKSVEYTMPNMNQCKGCHEKGGKMTPIGPSARQLNGDFTYPDGTTKNQLIKWSELGILEGLPDNLASVDKVPVWDHPETGSLNDRARAYLDINCAHCHRIDGPANTSGFYLDWYQANTAALGFWKSPIAAGRGSGGRFHDIFPGKPDESILYYRMNSTDPGVMMPELGRKLNHDEGLALIKEWIASLDPKDYPKGNL